VAGKQACDRVDVEARIGSIGETQRVEKRVLLRAVVFKSGDLWVGQCLEYDIAVQVKTPQ